MSNSQKPVLVKQQATGGKGSNIQQAGNNISTQASTNIVLIPILIGMTAMGGIAWAIYAGINHQDNPQVEQVPATQTQTNSTPTELLP